LQAGGRRFDPDRLHHVAYGLGGVEVKGSLGEKSPDTHRREVRAFDVLSVSLPAEGMDKTSVAALWGRLFFFTVNQVLVRLWARFRSIQV
jgi:hypothetical protein